MCSPVFVHGHLENHLFGKTHFSDGHILSQAEQELVPKHPPSGRGEWTLSHLFDKDTDPIHEGRTPMT